MCYNPGCATVRPFVQDSQNSKCPSITIETLNPWYLNLLHLPYATTTTQADDHQQVGRPLRVTTDTMASPPGSRHLQRYMLSFLRAS
ncbi:hypothetical protein GJ744_000582 [Endocarpon pusillum]|uniref:Uncharacterized protein n=1 Tax=Endocarpon pusillum TaxID=364733 RepID=A0A8H7E179_9EURO|nr:hypothetical protein GJ744_000582 [Endocarpon pusillum]